MEKTTYSNPIFTSETQVKLFASSDALPFFDRITSIFLGYKQCYSDNVFGEIDLDEIDLDEMLQAATKYNSNFNINNIKSLIIIHSDEPEKLNKIKRYFYMCLFIQKHMYHESPVEHANLSFWHRFSRVASHQHVRHRVGVTPSQQSQRYVEMSEPECYIPTSISNNVKAKEIYMNAVAQLFSNCQKIVDLEDKNIKDEDIRFLYPGAALTEIVTSFNFRSLIHYFEERCCTRASDEIRIGANKMLELVQREIPFIFDNAGPKCKRLKYCPEKHGACGRVPKFKDLTIKHIQQYK